jgi:hypothetical protein
MAIIKVTKHEERSGEVMLVRNNLLREVKEYKFTERYTVVLDSAKTHETDIINHPDIPAIGARHPKIAQAVVVHKHAIRTASKVIFNVDVEFSTEHTTALFTENPLKQPPTISISSDDYDGPVYGDVHGNPFLTSAGNRIIPVPSRKISRSVITIRRNVPFWSQSRKDVLQYKLNARPWPQAPGSSVYGTGKAILRDITAERQVSNGIEFWQEEIVIEGRKDPRDSFFERLLDADVRDVDGKIFRDPISGQQYTHPTLLNGRGRSTVLEAFLITNDFRINVENTNFTPPVLAWKKVPPKPLASITLWNGAKVQPGPYDTSFVAKIYDVNDKDKFEYIRVINWGIYTPLWTVIRGNPLRGLPFTEQNWLANTAKFEVVAYYNLFNQYGYADWGTVLGINMLRI